MRPRAVRRRSPALVPSPRRCSRHRLAISVVREGAAVCGLARLGAAAEPSVRKTRALLTGCFVSADRLLKSPCAWEKAHDAPACSRAATCSPGQARFAWRAVACASLDLGSSWHLAISDHGATRTEPENITGGTTNTTLFNSGISATDETGLATPRRST